MKETALAIGWLIKLTRKHFLAVSGAVFLGVVSYSSVMAIPLIGVNGIDHIINHGQLPVNLGWQLISAVIARSLARYGEQYLNHHIAFHLLADARHQLFKQLRRLAPAKLQRRDKGDYISMVTSDVEMLEIFFAHTISPILIASIMWIVLVGIFSQFSFWLALVAGLTYALLAIVVPILPYYFNQMIGEQYKKHYTQLNQTVLEISQGVKDIQQFGLEQQMLERIMKESRQMNDWGQKKSRQLTIIQVWMEWTIGLASALFLVIALNHSLSPMILIGLTVLFVSSFGPFIPLSMLGNELLPTLASAKRLFRLIQEEPLTEEIKQRPSLTAISPVRIDHVSFKYDHVKVLENVSRVFPVKGLVGIKGVSGRGKSTLLHLLMRFWDVDQGSICFDQRNLMDINTDDLRGVQGYMTQTTDLFNGTIADNIRIGKSKATLEEVKQAAKKAALDDMISQLPDGYETMLEATGRELSDGEKQRMGLARLFLHDAPMMLLDEPTSHLDYLNEQLILHKIRDMSQNKLVLLVSHRETSLKEVDQQWDL